MTEPSRDGLEFGQDLYNTTLLYQLNHQQRQQTLLQWEQLNLLRQHQGLAPLPPPVFYDPGREILRIFGKLIKWTVYLFVIILILQGIGRITSAIAGG